MSPGKNSIAYCVTTRHRRDKPDQRDRGGELSKVNCITAKGEEGNKRERKTWISLLKNTIFKIL
jgi:hypothetical protein